MPSLETVLYIALLALLAGAIAAPLLSLSHFRSGIVVAALTGAAIALLASNSIDVTATWGRFLYGALSIVLLGIFIYGLAIISSPMLRRWFAVSLVALTLEAGFRVFPAYDSLAANPGVKFFWPDWVYFRMNNFGHRDRDFVVPKPPGTYRIVLLGDSFTEGAGLARSETFGRLIERQNVEVCNLGHSGYNTRQEADVLLRDGDRLQPDMVILNYVMNDAETHPLEVAYINIPEWYSASERVLAQRLGSYFAYAALGRIAQLLPKNFPNLVEFYRSQHRVDGPGWKEASSALDDIRTWAADHHVPVVALIWPIFANDLDAGDLHAFVAGELTKRGFRTIDLLPYFLAQTPRLRELGLSSIDWHPNRRANELVAALLRKELTVR